MKETLHDLALFGGPPAFESPLFVGRPNIANRQRLMQRIEGLLDRRWLTNNGPLVREFEQAVCEYTGVKHCIAMCNGTIALEIAIRAAELQGEVIVPSFTFVATAHALQWQQIAPVFCDIDPQTHTIDPERVEELITPRTTAIIGTHIWGQPCAVEALEDIAHRHNLRLMFDAAHAFGCSYNGKAMGNFGDGEIYSFHATKFINAFEGGAFVTHDDELAERVRLMQNFGFAGFDNVIHVGTNGKMSEPSAAMALTSLEGIDAIIEVNRRNYMLYKEHLSSVRGLRLFEYDLAEKQNFQYIIGELDPDVVGLSRDILVEVLQAEQVVARRYFYPGCHRMEPYKSLYPKAHLWLPQTERLCAQVFALPTGTAMSEESVKDLCHLIQWVLEHAGEISERRT